MNGLLPRSAGPSTRFPASGRSGSFHSREELRPDKRAASDFGPVRLLREFAAFEYLGHSALDVIPNDRMILSRFDRVDC